MRTLHPETALSERSDPQSTTSPVKSESPRASSALLTLLIGCALIGVMGQGCGGHVKPPSASNRGGHTAELNTGASTRASTEELKARARRETGEPLPACSDDSLKSYQRLLSEVSGASEGFARFMDRLRELPNYFRVRRERSEMTIRLNRVLIHHLSELETLSRCDQLAARYPQDRDTLFRALERALTDAR